jgi:hypothetical protein
MMYLMLDRLLLDTLLPLPVADNHTAAPRVTPKNLPKAACPTSASPSPASSTEFQRGDAEVDVSEGG